MTAQIYFKIQNTYALLGNKQYKFDRHNAREKVLSKVFLEVTAQKC